MIRKVVVGILLVCVVLLPGTGICAAQPVEEWNKTFGGSLSDCAESVQQTSDGGYIIAGSTEASYSAGVGDVWLIKTNSIGNKEWDNTFGGFKQDMAYSVQQTSDGGYILAGKINAYQHEEGDVWLIKTDSNGNKLWNKTFGGVEMDWAYSVQQTSDGGYIITGHTKSYGAGGRDVWLIKMDSNGNNEWDKTFGGVDSDSGESVQQTTDGGYIISGATSSFGADDWDVWLIKTDSNGNKEWDKIFGRKGSDIGHSVQQTSDGGYIIAGETSLEESCFWLVKMDSHGNKEWEKLFEGIRAWSVQQTSDGGYIIAGETTRSGSFDAFVVKTDSRGNKEWDKSFGGAKGDTAHSVQQTSDGGYIIAGDTSSYGNGDADVWLIKLGVGGISTPAPTVTPTSVTATPTPATIPTPIPKPQGFEVVFAIAGLLAVVYIRRRNRK